MNPWLLTIPTAYLLGSIPFGYLLVRFVRKQDVRATGSGNIGATNVARAGGKGLGLATLLLDVAKSYLAVKLAQHLAPGNFDLAMSAAIAAVLGHVIPVWLRFRGGKGVASALGVFLALSPILALLTILVFALIFALSRFVSLASIVSAAAVPLMVWHLAHGMSPLVVFGFLFIPLLIIVKHHANIRRLIAGTESRFSARKVTA